MVKVLFTVALAACLLASGYGQEAAGGGNLLSILNLGDLLGGSGTGANPLSAAVDTLNGVLKPITGSLGLPAIPDVNAILNKALAAISSIQSAALGPKGPINRVKELISTAQGVVSELAPQVLNSAVAQSTKAVQIAIDQSSKGLNVSSNPEAAQKCIADAQKALIEVVPKIVSEIKSCSDPISKDISSIVQKTIAFYVEVPLELGKAGINLVLQCAGYVLPLNNNGFEKCIDQAVAEVKGNVEGALAKIDSGFDTVQSLVQQIKNCVSNGIKQAEKFGQEVEAQLNACLAG